MSHEVRTPLTSVLGATELLADGTLDEDQQHLVRIVQRSGEKLLRLVNDILDVSRLEAGHASRWSRRSSTSARWSTTSWPGCGRWPRARG